MREQTIWSSPDRELKYDIAVANGQNYFLLAALMGILSLVPALILNAGAVVKHWNSLAGPIAFLSFLLLIVGLFWESLIRYNFVKKGWIKGTKVTK